MTIALNTALEHIRTLCAAIDGMHAERVHIGPIVPGRVSSSPHIVIAQDRNRGERIDGGKTVRVVPLRITVLMRIDPVKGDPDIQINTIYEPMHAAFEQVVDGVADKFLAFTEVEDSLQYDTDMVEERPLRLAYADWNLYIERTLGQTD